MFGVIKNCLYKLLWKYFFYREVEFVWIGSIVEGVNIFNFDRYGDGKFYFEFEMDIFCVF